MTAGIVRPLAQWRELLDKAKVGSLLGFGGLVGLVGWGVWGMPGLGAAGQGQGGLGLGRARGRGAGGLQQAYHTLERRPARPCRPAGRPAQAARALLQVGTAWVPEAAGCRPPAAHLPSTLPCSGH